MRPRDKKGHGNIVEWMTNLTVMHSYYINNVFFGGEFSCRPPLTKIYLRSSSHFAMQPVFTRTRLHVGLFCRRSCPQTSTLSIFCLFMNQSAMSLSTSTRDASIIEPESFFRNTSRRWMLAPPSFYSMLLVLTVSV